LELTHKISSLRCSVIFIRVKALYVSVLARVKIPLFCDS
jgi:hypothetical protein